MSQKQDGKTLPVPIAGRRYFGLGKNASYEAAKRGEIPVIKIGARLRVPIVALEKMLERAGADKAEAPNASSIIKKPPRAAELHSQQIAERPMRNGAGQLEKRH